MNTLLICALGLSLVAVVLALIRESRLRRGLELEKVVVLLLNNWRTRDGEHGVEHDTKRD